MSPSRPLVSALFASPAAAEKALALLQAGGLPRDLIELAVSEDGAREHYAGRVRRGRRRETLRYAGVGGMVGLVLGASVALLLLALPGRTELDATIVAQLLGPNLSTLVGALIGGVAGFFVRARVDTRLRRVLDAGSAVLVAAQARSTDEAHTLLELLRESGGEAAQIDR